MKKRRWKRGLAVVLGLTLGIYAPVTALHERYPAYAYTERSASVNATTLNVRSDAGTGYNSVGKLSRGTVVTVIGEKTGTDGKLWYQIRSSGGVTGYVLGSYLTISASAGTSTPGTSAGTSTSGTSTPGSTSTVTPYRTNQEFESALSKQGFPESYKAALRQLHAQYPNWIFLSHNTGLDWNSVIENESLIGRNLVHTDSISSFKSTADGAYNWDTSTWNGFDGSSWVAASEDVIRYYMDPRNFLDATYIFQFMSQEYNASVQTKEGLQSMLNGTFMQGAIVSNGSASGSTGIDTSSGNDSDGTSSSGSSGNSGSTSGGPGVSGGSTSAPGGQSAVIVAPDRRNQNSGSSTSSTSSSSGTSSSTVTPGTSSGTTSTLPGASSGNSSDTGAGPGTSSSGTSGNANATVRFQGPSASISRHETNLVTAPDVLTAGPGTSAGAATFTAPGSAGPGGASSTAGSSSSGTTAGTTPASGTIYADLIMNVAASTGLNPYIIASTILQEQGSDGRGKSISGTYSGYSGYYNYFNVGAYASGGMDAVGRGLWYASQSGTYGRPWNTPEKSIAGGAEYYATNYLQAGQDTLYLKKFNVQGSNIYKHQYMTNVEAAASEGAFFGQGYANTLKNVTLIFKIPVYNNMPSSPCAKPTGTGSPNNKLRSLSVDGFTLTPTFNRDTTWYDLIVNQSVTSVNVNASAIDSNASTAGTGTVSLSGESTEINVVVTAQNGTKRTYTINVVKNSNGPTYGGSIGGGQSTTPSISLTPGGSSSGPGTGTGSGTSAGTSSSPVVSVTPGGSSSTTSGNSMPGGTNSGSSTQVTPVIGVAPGQ